MHTHTLHTDPSPAHAYTPCLLWCVYVSQFEYSTDNTGVTGQTLKKVAEEKNSASTWKATLKKCADVSINRYFVASLLLKL